MRQNGEKFKQLEAFWYAKLREEKFQDIEDTSHSERPLKDWSMNFFRNKFDEIAYQTTLDYYKWARKILHSFKFQKEIHRQIWELYCEGFTVREISEQIRVYSKSTVHNVIQQILVQVRNR